MGKYLGQFVVLCLFSCLFFAALAAASDDSELEALKKKAESGDAQAKYLYADELAWTGIEMKKAMEWYEKAAEQGNPYAKIALASLRLAKVKPASPEGKNLADKICPPLRPVIEQLEKEDGAEAAYSLGDVYANGVCVKEDEKKGRKYFEKAAEAGQDKASMFLADMLIDDPATAAKGMDLLHKAFDKGQGAAGFKLAMYYFAGKGTEKSDSRAMKIVDKIANGNDSISKARLGYAFYRGKWGFPKNEALGKKLLGQAADNGVAMAQKFLEKNGGKK